MTERDTYTNTRRTRLCLKTVEPKPSFLEDTVLSYRFDIISIRGQPGEQYPRTVNLLVVIGGVLPHKVPEDPTPKIVSQPFGYHSK